MQADGYAGRPCYPELVLIVLAGALHVVVELGFSARLAIAYNVSVSIAFLAYVVWRIRRTPGVLRIWGLRRDNFLAAFRAQLWFVLLGVPALVALATAFGSLALPGSFWLTIALYPVWGVTQQFALQNLIAKNLATIFARPLALAVVAATLFAVSHYPRLDLMVLTFVAGVAFTLIYRKVPNLWAVGIAHGLLGSLAFYLVLGEDPGAAILGVFMRHS